MPPSLIICEGDSITVGVGGSPNYPQQLGTLLGAGWDVVNVGGNSETIAQMLGQAATQVDPLYDLTRARNICAIFAGTNDFYFGASVASVEADYQAYCEARQSIGFELIAFTIMPRSEAGAPLDFESKRQAFNTWLRVNYLNFADRLVDIAADPRMGDAGDETDTTYFADLVHPTTTGYGVIASHVHGVIAGRSLEAAAGLFAVSGQAASLRAALKLAAVAGSFALTGQPASFLYGHRLAAGAASYAFTGNAAILSSGVHERGRVISLRAVPYVQPEGSLEYIQPSGSLQYIQPQLES